MVHQCAHLSHNPRQVHEIFLNHIARYLKYIKKKGLIIQPDHTNLKLDSFADANFAGFCASEDNQNTISVKSRTGVLLNFGGVPIYWSLKIQSEIALSTLEAEYIGLS